MSREKLLTRMGEIEVVPLEEVGPRSKYWAGALQDLVRPEQVYQVVATALEEAFRYGRMKAVFEMTNKFADGEVIDVQGEEVRSSVEGSVEPASEAAPEGPQPEEPADPDKV